MALFRNRFLLLLGLMAAFAALLFAVDLLNARPRAGVSVFSIPRQMASWKSIDMPVYDDTRTILETDQVLMREYNDGARRLLLAVVYYPDSRVALHLPESCYTGQGSQIVERRKEKVNGLDANLFLLEGDKGNKAVLYYFLTGNYVTGNYGKMRWRMMKNRILGRDTGCALVRLTIRRTDHISDDLNTLRDFTWQLNAILPRYLT